MKQQINPILVKIQTDIENKVTPENKKAFDKAVLAAETIMFDKKSHANLEMVQNPEKARADIVGTITKGVSGLMWLLFMQSKQTMKHEVLIMTGIVTITKAFDFAERGLGIPITPAQIAQATKLCIEALFQKMGITPAQLSQAIESGRKEIEDYQAHQQMLNGKMQALRPQAR